LVGGLATATRLPALSQAGRRVSKLEKSHKRRSDQVPEITTRWPLSSRT
jgi:hypothetical protein